MAYLKVRSKEIEIVFQMEGIKSSTLITSLSVNDSRERDCHMG